MMFGAVNNAGTAFTELDSTSGFNSLFVTNTGAGNGVVASDLGTGTGIPLLAECGNPANTAPALSAGNGGGGDGIQAFSVKAYGLNVRGAGLAPLLLAPSTTSGPPMTGTHQVGEVFVDANGALFQCVGAGTPGTWVRVGFNLIPATRILDTRRATHIGPITGPIGPGQTVSMAVAGAHGVPTQASGVVLNATVTERTAASFLTIWPEGATRPSTSNLNWYPGQFVATR